MTRNRSILLFLLLACVVIPAGYMVFSSNSGCSGLAGETDEEREKTEAERRKEEEEEKEKEELPFEPLDVVILPGMMPTQSEDEGIDTVDGTQGPDGEPEVLIEGAVLSGARRVAAKPGHWVHARYTTKANDFDFSGQLIVECLDASLNSIDLERSPFRASTSRPVVFPKGQYRSAELPVYIPTRADSDRKKRVQLHAKLSRRSGRQELQGYSPTVRLKAHQYHLVVLASDPDAYAHLRDRDSIKPPLGSSSLDSNGLEEDYIVTLHGLDGGDSLLLPGNPLAWTSIAYLIWDELPPDSLAPDQQQALLDWLHWGGQIIMSGPRSLDPLRTSFLADYLPATSSKTVTATPTILKELNDVWSLDPKLTEIPREKYRLASTEERPLELTPLTPREGAQVVPKTGGLVVERPVGRGRIVVTAFSLSDRAVVNWQNFDGFLNGCLLRRPGRRFSFDQGVPLASMKMNGLRLPRRDSLVNCGLRYFTRDAAIRSEGRIVRPPPVAPVTSVGGYNRNLATTEAAADAFDATVQSVFQSPERKNAQTLQSTLDAIQAAKAEEAAAQDETQRAEAAKKRTSAEKLKSRLEAKQVTMWGVDWKPGRDADRLGMLGYESDVDAGIGGWSDFSPASSKARMSLQEAAGISVPTAGFVAKVLAGYLLCLVPLNWLLFRLIRKVEWAWFAAPLIAIAGAVCVVRLAQLDIGFVRSRTEIAVLEMQPGYERGHLTRYCGMYTSLTSDYAVEFEDSNAVGLPFSTNPSFEQLRLQKQKGRAVPFVRDKKVALSGYPVLSNSTGMVHVEQMVELPGRLKLEQTSGQTPTLENGMDWEVKGAVAMHLTTAGVRLISLGDLAPGDKVDLAMAKPQPATQMEDVRQLLEQLQSDPATAAVAESEGIVSLRELVRLGLEPASMRPGAWRVVGWTDEEVPGMEITPVSNQNLYRTLIVCHLDHGDYMEPQVDENHSVDFPMDDSLGDIDFSEEDAEGADFGLPNGAATP